MHIFTTTIYCLTMKNVFACVAILAASFSSNLHAQGCDNPFDIMAKGLESFNGAYYQDALEQFQKIHPNDTTYAIALYEQAFCLYQMERYDEAIELFSEGLEMTSEVRVNFFNSLANAYDEAGDQEKAIEYYDQGLVEFPYNGDLHHNKGIVLEKMDRWEEAYQSYQNGLLVAPYHAGCHYRLGRLAAHQELITQSMLAYTMSILVEPLGDNAVTRLVEMENMLSGKFEREEFELDLTKGGEDTYPDIDMALENNFANNSSYKYPHKKVDYAFARHLHLALTALQEMSGNEGFWGENYVPLFKQIMKDGNFNYMINSMVIQVEDPKIQSHLGKKSTRVKTIAFMDKLKNDWDELNGEKIFPMKQGEEKTKIIYSDARLVYGAGEYDGTGFTGYTEFYSSAGGVSAYGEFNSNYKKEGQWHYFYKDGTIKEISDWENGDLNGWYHEFNLNGTRSRSIALKNNQRDGLSLEYDDEGVLMSSMEYVAGELEGDILLYHENGQVKRSYSFKDGEANGWLLEYSANGQKTREVMLKDGNLDGLETEWYSDGSKSSEYNYDNGEREGEFVSYYNNGQVYRRGKYKSDKLVGLVEEFHIDGSLSETEEYDESGKMNGTYKDFDQEGNLLTQMEYKRGEIYSYQQFDRNGKLLREETRKGGKFEFEGFYNDGVQRLIGMYDAEGEGQKIGEWKYFDRNGMLSSVENFDENGKNGVAKSYASNGQKTYEATYLDNELNGEIRWYYDFGKLKREGQVNDGLYCGEFRSYFGDGTMSAKNYYIDGYYHGKQYYYTVDGELERIDTYANGKKMNVELHFEGNAYHQTRLDSGKGVYELKFPHGETMGRIEFSNYKDNGATIYYFVNGNVQAEGVLINGSKNGGWKYYHPNGQLSAEGVYSMGDQEGEWRWYDEDGNLETIRRYEHDEMNGLYETFYENGQVEVSIPYVHDLAHGDAYYYAPSGEVQMVRNYHYDKMEGITWEGRDGKLLPFTLIENETIEVTPLYANGKPARSFKMVNDNFQGSYKEFWPNGKLLGEAEYLDGNRNGVSTLYYANGKLKSERNYVHGSETGTSKFYYSNGKLKSSSEWLNDEKHGTEKLYDKAGKLIETRIWRDGDLIQIIQ